MSKHKKFLLNLVQIFLALSAIFIINFAIFASITKQNEPENCVITNIMASASVVSLFSGAGIYLFMTRKLHILFKVFYIMVVIGLLCYMIIMTNNKCNVDKK